MSVAFCLHLWGRVGWWKELEGFSLHISTGDKAHLEIIFPWHICVDMSGRAVHRCGLFLQRRCSVIVIIGRWPLPFFHLDKIRRRKSDGPTLDEGHEGHRHRC